MSITGPLGGGAYAAVKIGTKDIRNGAVTSAKVKNRSLALRDFKRPASLQGKTGAAGPQGIAGPQGPEGPVDAKYWAVYRDGLDRSTPGVSLVAVNPNSIVLQFDSPVRQCAWVVGTGNTDASPSPDTLMGVSSADAARNDRLIIRATNLDGTPGTPAFHLAVFC